MPDTPRWICCRQRAGPLVKESRAIRPRLSKDDSPYERAEKNKILRPPRDSSVCRTRVDRLELLLALFGFDGWSYTLTFSDDNLPGSFKEVRDVWRRFLYKLRRWRNGKPFDYVYLIEGKHGDHRYHIHLTVRYSDFPPVYMEELWGNGYVEGKPLLLGPYDTYRRTARYYCKESSDGVVIPIDARTWNASRSLTAQLPPPEYWRDTSGRIEIPPHPRTYGRNRVDNGFGHYNYGWYIEQDPLRPTLDAIDAMRQK